jgi:hypothetical protein
MIIYTTATASEDLDGILKLQKANLPKNLSQHEIATQGFVTIHHSLEDLKELNDIEQHVIAKDHEKVIAYLLAMTKRSRSYIPVLVPMFDIFDHVLFAGKTIADFNFIVVGQVCVDKNYRGIGILDNCYSFYKEHFKNKYEFAITEIDATNLRSLNAHKRIGFEEVYRYKSPDNTEWSIVLWDWRNE